MVEANLRNAVLQRAVFTRSDLKDAVVEGADFTNALLDKTQVMVGLGGALGCLGLWLDFYVRTGGTCDKRR